ncbi:hypothetical protein BGZ94_005149 [Podila epigama]|nr:hypothetical protein BGZ94_005149 [Podila epigama]
MTDHSEVPTNPVLRAVYNHYNDTTARRNPEQIEREKTMGFGPLTFPFNRWLLFPAAFIFQAICGSLYAWSVFNVPIDSYIYGVNAENKPLKNNAVISFYLAVGFFGMSAAVNGPWLERVGPRKASLIGTTLFFAGNMIASLGIHFKIIALIYFGYGVIGGAGLGLCYISPVSALQKWFPDRRGLAAGFAVCGFGAGSIALAKVPNPLIAAVGLTKTFIILGCCYFTVMFFCCLVFRIPPPGYIVNGFDIYRNKVDSNGDIEAYTQKSASNMKDPAASLTLIQSIFSTEYRLIYIMFFGNSLAGLVFLSRLANITQDIFGKDKDTAATIVAVNGGFNLAGRLFFATASDKLGRKTCYIVMLVSQVIILASLPSIMEAKNYPAFLAVIWILTACYGGGFGCIPAFLCDMFGPSNIGALHGIILTAWATAGVGGGLLFTKIFNDLIASKRYTVKDVWIYAINLYWILAIAAIGCVFILFVKTSIRDRLMPKIDGEFGRTRLFGRILRFGSFGVQYVTKDQEEAEWSTFVNSRSSPETLQEVNVGQFGEGKMELDENNQPKL